MTREETNKMVSRLRQAIIEKAKQGIVINEIRMGLELVQAIKAFNYNLECDYLKYEIRLYGIPVVVDYTNSRVLKIAFVEEIPVEGS